MENLIFWLVVSVAAMLVDILTSGFFFAGFTIGGVAAIICNISGMKLTGQVLVFVSVSIFSIGFEFLWLRKRVKKSIPKIPRMEQEYIGRIIKAEEDIGEEGHIKIGGIYWTVENPGDRVYKGDEVQIIGIKGNKFKIKKYKGE